MTAQGMSAGTAETQSGSGLQPASPVGNADAPNLNHTIPGGSMSQVTEVQAIRFLEHAFRNIDLPGLCPGDIEDVRDGLQHFMSSASPPVEQSEGVDLHDLRWAIVRAYEQGAKDAHDNYEQDRDPDFKEAGCDYADSIDLAALKEGHSLSTVSGSSAGENNG